MATMTKDPATRLAADVAELHRQHLQAEIAFKDATQAWLAGLGSDDAKDARTTARLEQASDAAALKVDGLERALEVAKSYRATADVASAQAGFDAAAVRRAELVTAAATHVANLRKLVTQLAGENRALLAVEIEDEQIQVRQHAENARGDLGRDVAPRLYALQLPLGVDRDWELSAAERTIATIQEAQ